MLKNVRRKRKKSRFYNFRRFRLGDDPIRIRVHFTDVYGGPCVPHRTVRTLDRRFRDGKIDTEKSIGHAVKEMSGKNKIFSE